MLTQEKPTIQVCAESKAKIWHKPTTKANVGDIIRSPFTPVMEVVSKYVYTDGRVWLKVKPTNASYYTEEWIVDKEEDDLLPQPKSEEEQGKQHGQSDAAEQSHPIYTEATCRYSAGYLAGYNGSQTLQQSKAPTAPTWSVIYDGDYWYKAWVDRVLVGKATTYQKAEQMAQKAIASQKFWQGHRERVLASYGD